MLLTTVKTFLEINNLLHIYIDGPMAGSHYLHIAQIYHYEYYNYKLNKVTRSIQSLNYLSRVHKLTSSVPKYNHLN